jgi:arsenate reductase (thioredoxin)
MPEGDPEDDLELLPAALLWLLLPAGVLRTLLLMAEKIVLFVCVENVGRSLMAEAFFNADPAPGWRAVSGGTQPGVRASPRTARMLEEIGLSLPSHPPQLATPAMIESSQERITMGCLDEASCPANLKTLRTVDWALPDPGRLDDAGARAVRDEIRERVKRLRSGLVLRDHPREPSGDARS